MKYILSIAILILNINTSFAEEEYDIEEHSHLQSISVRNINCEIVVGLPNVPIEQKMSTVLRGFIFNPFPNKEPLELKHDIATAKGCNFEVMDPIVLNAMHLGFGFASATVTLVKKTSRVPRQTRDSCIRTYKEQLIIEFAEDFVLKSPEQYKFIPADDC